MNPIITIAVPVFNRKQMTIETIRSVLAQKERGFELLIIDDTSTDGTWEELNKLNDPRIRLIRNSRNVGLVRNFNRCLENSRGKYTRILCSDDRLTSTCLKQDHEEIQRYPELALMSTPLRVIYPTKRCLVSYPDYFKPGIYSGIETAISILNIHGTTGNNPLNFPSGILFRTDLALQSGGFEPDQADLDLWLKILERGPFVFAKDPACEIIEHANRAAYKIFYSGLYVSSHRELIFRRIGKPYLPKAQGDYLMRCVFGRCAWYVFLCMVRNRFDGVHNHWRELKKFPVSTGWLFVALVQFFFHKIREKTFVRPIPSRLSPAWR